MSTVPKGLDFQLLPGTGEHLDAVTEIMERSFDCRFGEAWTRNQCSGILPLTGINLTLAYAHAGTPLGFTLSRTVADEAELLLIAVIPEAQGRGIGSALVEHFIQTAQTSGATRLHLEVRDGNPAIRAYGKFGFSQVGRRRNYYSGPNGDKFDALTLARSI